MDSISIEVIKKEIISKVDKLGDDYTTFSYANKLIVNHSIEKNLSCRILIYDDYFNFSIQFYDNICFVYRYLLRMENISTLCIIICFIWRTYKRGFLSLYIEPLVGEKTIVNLMGDSRTKDEEIMLDSAECLRQYLRKLNRLSLSMKRC